MLRLAAAALIIVCAALALQSGPEARTITLENPDHTVDLHDGHRAMAMRFQMIGQDEMKVTALFQPNAPGAQPREIVMHMDDGESITFALPGQAGPRYRFTRQGGALTAQIETASFPDVARAG